MTILLYYPKTQSTKVIAADLINIGKGGISWQSKSSHGFIGFCDDYEITVQKD